MRKILMKILLLAVVSLVGVAAQAQTVMPVFAEGKAGKHWVKGQFTVMNQGVQPLPVSVEPRQLQIVEGRGAFGMVQPGTEVELKDTSAVIAPRSSRTFDFKIHCETDCMVTFLSGMVTGKTKDGVLVKLWLPSSVFLCTEVKGCRARIKKAAGLP